MRHHALCAIILLVGVVQPYTSLPVSSMEASIPTVLSVHEQHTRLDASLHQHSTHAEGNNKSVSHTHDAAVPAGDQVESLVLGDQLVNPDLGDETPVLGNESKSSVLGEDSPVLDTRGSLHDSGKVTTIISPPGEGDTVEGRPRAIVDVRQKHMTGEASYIIHPDNQPPPTYQPLKNLPPPTRPVAQWRPDIFMKICCSDPGLDDSPEEGSGDAPEGTVSPDTQDDVGQTTDQPTTLPDDGDVAVVQDVSVEAAAHQANTSTLTPEQDNSSSNTHTSILSHTEELDNTLAAMNGSEVHPEGASNHTPRYEDANTSPYQDVANFLRDIANSDGFQNVFIGDLIRNFGSLDQNALKLIYSLLIGPLEESYKEDRMGTVDDDSPHQNVDPEDSVVLTRDRLPLRDRPEDGFQPLKTAFLQSRPSEGSSFPMRPSLPVRPLLSNDEMWRPGRIYDRGQPVNRRGEERVDVITAPPTKTFEVVLGSSLTHDSNKQRNGGGGGGGKGGSGGGSRPRPSSQASHPPVPFDKLTLGLEMPPPEALEVLPPGSILIPPSHIMGRPKLPQIFPPRGSGAPTLEMPLGDILPNLPFLTKPVRHRPPAQPKVQDIPPRLPGFLPSRRPTPPRPGPSRPPRPAIHAPPRDEAALHFPFMRQPTGPPPIVTKMTPPVVPTLPHPQRPRRPHHISMSASLSPYLTPPPPPPLSPPLSPPQPPPQPPPSPPPQPPPQPPPSPPLRPEAADKDQHNHSHTYPVVNVNGFGDVKKVGSESPATHYMSDGKEHTHHATPDMIDPNIHHHHHHHHPLHPDYYSQVPADYLDSYYNLDYDDYYHDDTTANAKQESPSDHLSHEERRPFVHEATATFHADAHQPRTPVEPQPPPPSPPPPRTTPPSMTVIGVGHRDDLPPSGTRDYPSLDDLLGVVKPNFSTPTPTKEVHFLLHNHRPVSTPPEEEKDVEVTPEQVEHRPPPQHTVEDNVVFPSRDFGTRLEPQQEREEPGVLEEASPPPPPPPPPPPLPSQGEHREHDASVSHLWKNLQLIPLTPDLFPATPKQPQQREDLNLTSLFDAAVPLAPDAALDLAPDLSSDNDHISVDQSGVRVTVREEVLEDPEKSEAKFMAYVLIGACCGLALLSITGVIVIVRFKKTCGSRQIKTRTRLTDQGSVENISRHVSHLTPAEESGHKLGSWFTGRNEHIGSGKLRGNMALPAVHDHKRDKKGGHSSSTRDLLSISSQSSPSNSPRQERRDGETGGDRTEEDEPRTSWLHTEYRTSEDELNQVAALDPHYRSQLHHQHQQHQHQHQHHQQGRGSSIASSSRRRHSSDHHRHHTESAAELDSASRSTRERRYTGQSSRDSERPPPPPHTTTTTTTPTTRHQHGSRYMSSLDSEELEDRLASHAREYPTDSELDDGITTHYDGESREPSRYFSDSRELDDVVGVRRRDHSSMTSQELGDHISRDLKQYQARHNSRSHHQRHHEELQHPPDSDGVDGVSSQEMESEECRELRRSQSQVSFSRDNVQNEVFLEFDSMLRQHGPYLGSEPLASTLGRTSLHTNDTRLSASRANTPDSIDLPEDFSQDSSPRRERDHQPPSPPNTPPRFSPPPAPPRPPKPGHLSQGGTPSPQAGRGRPPSPGHLPPSPPSSSSNKRPVYWTSDEERLI